MGGHSLLQGILSFLLISVNRGSRGRLKAGEERCPFCLPAIISFQYPPQPQSFAHHKPLVPASSTLWNQPHHTCKQQSVTSSTCPYSDGPASSLSSSLRSGSCFLQSLSVLASALSLCIQPSASLEYFCNTCYCDFWASQVVKNPPDNTGDSSLIPGLGRCPRGGNGNPLQYSCLGNPIDRGA